MSLPRRAANTLRRLGPRPLLLARHLGHGGWTAWRRRRLRRNYDRVVATPPAGAMLLVPELDLPPAAALPPALEGAAERIRHEAEAVLAHRVDYLGSGPVELGVDIDWHRDFKSGYRWEPAFYQDVEITRLDDSSDAKVPWELSRGHQLLVLARAARLFEDERFARELEGQLASWLAANPPGCGINWANPMEAALRAVNWLWAIGTLEGWRPLEPALRARVTASLQSHARHVAANLEGGPALRGNHYLAGVLGLLVLGWALPDDPRAARWLGRARRSLTREITTQVHSDGVGFEASLPYHGLSLEMFLLARVIAGWAGRPLSARYDERLARMLAVCRAVRMPDGRVPRMGDDDSGRVLPAGFSRPPRQDPLLWLGAAVLGRDRPPAGDPDEEVAWTLGLRAWRRAAGLSPAAEPPCAFPEGGLYVLRGGGANAVVRCGDVGQNGYGGHAHNDVLSYELAYGVPLVVDCGTYAYTFDLDARNAFRATAAHNVIAVDGEEINPIDPHEVFALHQVADPRVERWEDGPRAALLLAEHDGYRRLAGGVVHRRRLALDKETGELEVADELRGSGAHGVESFVHLAAGVTVAPEGPRRFALSRGAARVFLDFRGEGVEVDLGEGWISDGYGRRERAPVLVARVRAELPLSLGYRFTPAAGQARAAGPAVAEVTA